MRRLLIGILTVTAGLAADDASNLFQQALTKERTEGNLAEAIKLYQRIVEKHSANRKVAAQALLQLADCQSKLGDSQSRRSLERLVRDFPEQKDVAEQARVRLVRLNGARASAGQESRLVWERLNTNSFGHSISMDGRYVSFPHWASGNLGVRDLVAGTERLLTTNGSYTAGQTQYAEGTSISRDGKKVAYAWYDDRNLRYGLWVANLQGDPAPRRLLDREDIAYVAPTDWSQDGQWIAVFACHPRSDGQQGCFSALVSTQDGMLRTLRESKGMGSARVLFSQDGKYLIHKPPQGKVLILPVDGKGEAALLEDQSTVESAVWSPDGSKVFFVSDRSGTPALWWVSVKQGRPQGEPQFVRTGFGGADLMGFTRDGTLAYGLSASLTDIYVAGLDPNRGTLTSEPRRVNQSAVGNSWGRVEWLPDGKALSFWRRAPNAALTVHTLATKEEREIWGGKSGRSSYGYAGWYSDGNILARSQDASKMTFRKVNAGTGEVLKTWIVPALPQGDERFGNTQFSPELTNLYFATSVGTGPCQGSKCTHALIARSIETGRDREVLRLAALPRLFVASANGRDLAFLADLGPAQRTLVVVPSSGGEMREIYRFDPNDGAIAGLAWTKDGSKVLVFQTRENATGGEIRSIPLDGGPILKSSIHVRPSERPVVSPGGTQVAFVGGSRKSEIWMVTGLLGDSASERPR